MAKCRDGNYFETFISRTTHCNCTSYSFGKGNAICFLLDKNVQLKNNYVVLALLEGSLKNTLLRILLPFPQRLKACPAKLEKVFKSNLHSWVYPIDQTHL